ncbi:MAG: DNA alkylation repair protein [Planctomycetes bacterium]|nr:DNA alkylation repair protein [Planctomycetota bacterium]
MVTNRRTTKSPPKVAATARTKRATKPTAARASLSETMRELERAGSAQTRKTYARHGAREPMFGVSFATLKTLVKRIGVDHELALALWETGNHDARSLAVKIADPARIRASELDRWARAASVRSCGAYVPMLAAESPHGTAKARDWLASSDPTLRAAAWTLIGLLANLDERAEDAWFAQRLARIEKSIHTAPNAERDAMNRALIAIGGRNAAMRVAATAAARRIGKVDVDHGDTACKTPDAESYIEKSWAHATAKGFVSPAAQERARESLRTRC